MRAVSYDIIRKPLLEACDRISPFYSAEFAATTSPWLSRLNEAKLFLAITVIWQNAEERSRS